MEKLKISKIHALKLHETVAIKYAMVKRVASGWLYFCWNGDKQSYNSQPVFVPYSTQFRIEESEI